MTPPRRKITVKITIKTKKSVLSPESRVIQKTVSDLGCQNVIDISIGKIIEFVILSDDIEKTKIQFDNVTREFLCNPVTEDYILEIL